MTATSTFPVRRAWLPAVHAGLVRWGEWQMEHADCSGFPATSPISRLFLGGGDVRPGHRVLVLDMPESVGRMHRAWLRVGSIYRDALWCRYALPARPDGTMMTAREISRAIGISLDAYRSRVRHGRQQIAITIGWEREPAPLPAKATG